MVKALLDTTILVDLLRQYEPAHQWYARQSDLGVSAMVWVELLQGSVNRQAQEKALRLLNSLDYIEVEKADFAWAIEALVKFALSHNIAGADALIAATSRRLDVPLYTRNLKHFKPLIGERAQSPYS